MIIHIAFYVGILIASIVLFQIIDSKPIYFEYLHSIFAIHRVPDENSQIIVNFYGRKINYSEHRKFRVLIKLLVILSIQIVAVIFFDGCILSTVLMDSDGECPSISGSICLNMEHGIGQKFQVFDCPPNTLISSTNITARVIICRSWMFKSQSLFDIINQLGICTSILSLLGFTFRCIYRLASWRCWGTCLIIFLGLSMLVLLIIFLVVLRLKVAYLDCVLLISGLVALVIALLLVGFVRKLDRRVKLNCVEPIETPFAEVAVENC